MVTIILWRCFYDRPDGGNRGQCCEIFLPMFVSVIFQQMYSIFDSIIAGKFAGEDALAAVGASYPITMIFMAFAVGSNVGCCVVISQFFGGKEFSKVKTASTTTIISCTILATVLTVFGLAFSTPLMRMINTPDNIFRDGELSSEDSSQVLSSCFFITWVQVFITQWATENTIVSPYRFISWKRCSRLCVREVL